MQRQGKKERRETVERRRKWKRKRRSFLNVSVYSAVLAFYDWALCAIFAVCMCLQMYAKIVDM